MVTDRVMMEKTVSPLFSRLFFIPSFSYLQVTMTCMRARTSLNFGLIGPPTVELDALERLKKKTQRLIIGKMMSPLFLRSFTYLHSTMTYMRAWMSLNFSQIGSGTTELAALEHLKNRCCPFFSFHSCGYTWEIVR